VARPHTKAEEERGRDGSHEEAGPVLHSLARQNSSNVSIQRRL